MRLRPEEDQKRYEEYRRLVCEPAPDVWTRIESIWEQAFCVYAAPSGTNARIDPLLDLTALIVNHLPDARERLRDRLTHRNAQVAAYALFGLSWSYDFALPEAEVEDTREALSIRTDSVRVMQGKSQRLVPLKDALGYFCMTGENADHRERVRLNARQRMKLIVEAPDDFWERLFEIWADPRQAVPARLSLSSHPHPDFFMTVVPLDAFSDAEEGLRRGLRHASPVVVRRCVFSLSGLYDGRLPKRLLDEISQQVKGREEWVEITGGCIVRSARLCDLLEHLPGSQNPSGSGRLSN